jgi:hypothetical protein
MNYRQFLLCKLAEEASEVAKIALKTAQFGFNEKHPDLPFNNKERIHQELDDLAGIVEMLNDLDFDYAPNKTNISSKKEKVIKYLNYSVSLGCVDIKWGLCTGNPNVGFGDEAGSNA